MFLTSILDSNAMLNGFYRDGNVYIDRDLARAGCFIDGSDALSDRLVQVALEETAHFVTNGETDNRRDFQTLLFLLCFELADYVSLLRDRSITVGSSLIDILSHTV